MGCIYPFCETLFFVVKDEQEEVNNQQYEIDMSEVPVEVEMRLKKEAKRKRKFKPITSNKRRKGHS